MSAVLQSPSLPMLINLEDLNAYIQNQIEKALPAAVEKVLSDPENPMFLNAVERILAISDLKILKRLFTHDILLGLEEPFDTEEERAPNLPEQLKELSERIEQPLCRPTISIKMDTEIIPQTVTEHRAQELIEHLKNDIAPRNSEVFLTSREIMIFLKDGINVEYRIKKNVKNIRQVKKDVIEKAFEMFPTSVSLSKKSNGHKEVRVVLRQSSSVNLHTL
jgi:hypothetical protein